MSALRFLPWWGIFCGFKFTSVPLESWGRKQGYLRGQQVSRDAPFGILPISCLMIGPGTPTQKTTAEGMITQRQLWTGSRVAAPDGWAQTYGVWIPMGFIPRHWRSWSISLQDLALFFNGLGSLERFQAKWKMTVLFQCFKNGKKEDPGDYTLLVSLQCLVKLWRRLFWETIIRSWEGCLDHLLWGSQHLE